MNVIDYNAMLHSQFEELLVTYFTVDLNSDIPEDIIRSKLMNLINRQTAEKVIHVAIAMDDDIPVGFSIYQIDTPDSDWCKRPGWAFIREFHVARSCRHRGFGSALAAYSEEKLLQLGTRRIYLTSDDAADFWIHCGYKKTNEICSNDLPILEKVL